MNLNDNYAHLRMLKEVDGVLAQVHIQLKIWSQLKQLTEHVAAVDIRFEQVRSFVVFLALEAASLTCCLDAGWECCLLLHKHGHCKCHLN